MTIEERTISIPTYPIGSDERNPMFFEKRNVQGAAGNIFPMAMNTALSDEKIDRDYTALVLENDYVQTTILPELGGKIYRALDKAHNYDFIYYNRVIKPALIGLCGPWTSGGIEFNWPQHHRPTTFSPVEYSMERREDGSVTAWLGEVEPLNRTKGMVGVTMRPDKSWIKAEIRLYNRTDLPQSFMWWANLAVAVNDSFRAVFPPDIHWSSDHAWALTSSFPVVQGQYKTVNWGDEGRDVRDFPNVNLSSSYFTYNSKYDFLSGYDFSVDSGVVHVADRHVSPGKKMFTWGVGDFGQSWCGKLTDEDGPYIELMTGVFTCNQPDFSWIWPHELKRAEQYWYPIHGIGEVKSATIDAALSAEFVGGALKIGLNVTGVHEGGKLAVKHKGAVVWEKPLGGITPKDAIVETVPLPDGYRQQDVEICFIGDCGRALVRYQPEGEADMNVPEPYDPSPAPGKLDSVEALYLHALHLYQYRHPDFDPEDYLAEALRRAPDDVRCNVLKGRILLQRLDPEGATKHLQRAADALLDRNPNPYETEALYLLGVAQIQLSQWDEAHENLSKAAWAYAWKSCSYALLAMLDGRRGDWEAALSHADEALLAGGGNQNALWIKAVALRKLGRACEAALPSNPLDLLAAMERSIASGTRCAMLDDVSGKPESAIDVASRYALAGCFDEAAAVLRQWPEPFAPVLYHLGYALALAGDADGARDAYARAAALNPVGCLHGRPESLPVLRAAMDADPSDSVAPYLLGNMLYAARQHEAATALFEESIARGANFATVYRNLSYGLFRRGDAARAGELIKRAFEMDPEDSYVFFDLCQYLRNTNAPVSERIALYEKHRPLVDCTGRDDNYNMMCAAYIEAGQFERAQQLLRAHNYHSYEGGEGVSVRLHAQSSLMAGIVALEAGDAKAALQWFEGAALTPENFHEGTRIDPHSPLAENAHIDLWRGRALEALGDMDAARARYEAAASDPLNALEMRFYAAQALRKLGRNDEADALCASLLKDAEAAVASAGSYQYFRSAASYLPYEGDKRRKDLESARHLRALGLLGCGRRSEARAALDEAAALCALDYKSAFVSAHFDMY